MLDLNKVVQETIAKMDHEGQIQNLVEEKVTETIESIMGSYFSSYSQFGKGLKEYIDNSLNINFEKIGLDGYHAHITNLLSTIISQKLYGESAEKMKSVVASLLSEAPKQIFLSEIISKMKEQFTADACDSDARWESMTCKIDGNDRYFRYIGLDPEPGKARHQCTYSIGLHKTINESKWEVFSIEIGGKDVTANLFAGPLYNIEKLLHQMYCANSEIILDISYSEIEDACQYELSEEEDHC